jgi:hypothetical protein
MPLLPLCSRSYATFFEDPDDIRLEILNFREVRRKRIFDWEARVGL